MKREDLEKLGFYPAHGFDSEGGMFYVSGARENESDVKLMAAAPKLALACLDALAIAVDLGAWGMCEMLREALEAAGVEVEP